MYAAFGLFGTRPATGADILALPHGLGAGPAADGGEALGHQRMGRQVMLGHVGVELGLAPVGQGIELHLAVGLFHHRQGQAVAAVEALAAGDPAVEALQGGVQRDHLADVAAGVGVGLPEVGLGIDGGQVGIERPQVAHVGEAELGRQTSAVVQRLAKQHAGVEEHDRHVRLDPGDHVQQHRRLRPERGDQGQLVAEGLYRRFQHGHRVGVAQFSVESQGDLRAFQVIKGHAQDSARSVKAGVRPSEAR